MLVGLSGYNLFEERSDDRWGIGFYHFGVSQQLITSLQNLDLQRSSEGGVEIFYNLAINKWSYLSADFQIIEPWISGKPIESIFAIRMQNRF
jgi:porin